MSADLAPAVVNSALLGVYLNLHWGLAGIAWLLAGLSCLWRVAQLAVITATTAPLGLMACRLFRNSRFEPINTWFPLFITVRSLNSS